MKDIPDMKGFYLEEDMPEVDKRIELIVVLSAEAVMHAKQGRFDKKDFHLSKINEALSDLRELHLKLDDEEIKVRSDFF